MSNVLEESKEIKIEADKLLLESKIFDLLETYGEVKIGGSYALDTMIRRDLDFFAITHNHDINKVAEINSQIIKSKYFHIVHYGNWHEFKPQPHESNAVEGYYFALYCWVNGFEWKSDVWLITSDQDKTAETTDHFSNLLDKEIDERKRISILEIKKDMREGSKYIEGVDGKLIYKAVLEHSVKNTEEFNEFIKKFNH